jgi:hypothetical protein
MRPVVLSKVMRSSVKASGPSTTVRVSSLVSASAVPPSMVRVMGGAGSRCSTRSKPAKGMPG